MPDSDTTWEDVKKAWGTSRQQEVYNQWAHSKERNQNIRNNHNQNYHNNRNVNAPTLSDSEKQKMAEQMGFNKSFLKKWHKAHNEYVEQQRSGASNRSSQNNNQQMSIAEVNRNDIVNPLMNPKTEVMNNLGRPYGNRLTSINAGKKNAMEDFIYNMMAQSRGGYGENVEPVEGLPVNLNANEISRRQILQKQYTEAFNKGNDKEAKRIKEEMEKQIKSAGTKQYIAPLAENTIFLIGGAAGVSPLTLENKEITSQRSAITIKPTQTENVYEFESLNLETNTPTYGIAYGKTMTKNNVEISKSTAGIVNPYGYGKTKGLSFNKIPKSIKGAEDFGTYSLGFSDFFNTQEGKSQASASELLIEKGWVQKGENQFKRFLGLSESNKGLTAQYGGIKYESEPSKTSFDFLNPGEMKTFDYKGKGGMATKQSMSIAEAPQISESQIGSIVALSMNPEQTRSQPTPFLSSPAMTTQKELYSPTTSGKNERVATKSRTKQKYISIAPSKYMSIAPSKVKYMPTTAISELGDIVFGKKSSTKAKSKSKTKSKTSQTQGQKSIQGQKPIQGQIPVTITTPIPMPPQPITIQEPKPIQGQKPIVTNPPNSPNPLPMPEPNIPPPAIPFALPPAFIPPFKLAPPKRTKRYVSGKRVKKYIPSPMAFVGGIFGTANTQKSYYSGLRIRPIITKKKLIRKKEKKKHKQMFNVLTTKKKSKKTTKRKSGLNFLGFKI